MSSHSKEELETKSALSASPQEDPLSAIGDVEKTRIWRKLDIYLLPPVALLFLSFFLDLANLGNTRIAGMGEDLHLTGFKFNMASAIYYIPGALVEVPSTILLKVFRPSLMLPSLMLAWGVITTLTCLVQSYHGLLVVRFFLGLTEGAVLPGVAYFVSLWYPRRMQAKRVAFFISSAAMSGAFSGIFAYGLEHLDGKAGLSGWRWIFLIEGLATVVIGFCLYFFIHDWPETARFLTEEERRFVVQTLKDDCLGQETNFSTASVRQAFTDWKTYVHALNNMCIGITVNAIAIFTPTIVHELGFSAASSQLLSAPPFACGSILAISVGMFSDRMNLRGPFLVAGATFSMIGYIIAYTTSTPGPGYAGAVMAACGAIPLIPLALIWSGMNSGGIVKRGAVLAIVTGISNLGSVSASFVYYQPPRFHTGHGVVIGSLGTTILCSCLLMWTYKRLNEEKEEQCAREAIDESKEDLYRDLADKSPLFRYII